MSAIGSQLLGESIAMQALRAMIARVAARDVAVAIRGETGTGKELVAQALHQASGRRGPLISVNSSALPSALFESNLFGHRKGAFTGATENRRGLLSQAHGGTLFLDEIGDMPPEQQPKLLRAIELKIVSVLGSERDERSDFRVVVATHADLMELVDRGRFRADLAHRLQGFVLAIPPLRERVEDIPLLARHFLHLNAETSGDPAMLTPSAVDLLQAQAWPGNVRQLRTVLVRAALMSEGAVIPVSAIMDALGQRDHGGAAPGRRIDQGLGLARTELLVELDEAGWDTDELARRYGVDRSTIYRRMERLGIDPQARKASLRTLGGSTMSATRGRRSSNDLLESSGR